LSQAYETELDPRLNYEQSLELAMMVASKLASIRAES
jgi:3-deoxy-D-arabino-heptulosonate 7-phosphate (DAHP) synthase class II